MTGPLLSLEGVSKTYWRGTHELCVLRDVSLELRAGEVVAVYGGRGAGKTTLLKIASGIEVPDAGRVMFDGCDLTTVRGDKLAALHRAALAWVRRGGPFSAEIPVLEHVAMPLLGRYSDREARRRARQALADVGAEAVACEPWASLSDAERTLAAIAHGMVRSPRLLLADDPTANLDAVDRARVAALLRELAERSGTAILMTVPDLPSTRRSHVVMSLNDGRLLAPERPDDGGKLIDFPSGRTA